MVSGPTVELVHTIRGATIRRFVVSDAERVCLIGIRTLDLSRVMESRLEEAGFDLAREFTTHRELFSRAIVFEQVMIPAPRPAARDECARRWHRFNPYRWALEIALGVAVAAIAGAFAWRFMR